MKFKCKTKYLLKSILLISNICQTKSTKQILQDIKLVVDNSIITLLGTDLEIAIKYCIKDVEIVENGVAALPAVKLLNMIREIDDESVEFSLSGRECLIKSKDANFKLIGDDPEEFPIIPNYDFSDSLSIESKDFVNYAEKTLFSVAKDLSCYAYNGVLVERYENSGIKLVATDGRRLAVAGDVEKESENLLSSSVVPVKGIIQLIKSIDKENTPIQLKVFKNQFIVKVDNVEIAARLLEGEFPKYKEVIPKNNETVITIDKEVLYSAFRKVAITAGSEARSVLLAFKEGNLTLSSYQEGIGESKAEISIDYSGKKIEISFNPDYIMDYLKVIENSKVKLLLKDEESSCMIEDNEKEFYVIMPIT